MPINVGALSFVFCKDDDAFCQQFANCWPVNRSGKTQTADCRLQTAKLSLKNKKLKKGEKRILLPPFFT